MSIKMAIVSLGVLGASVGFAGERYDCKIDSYISYEKLPEGRDVSCSPWEQSEEDQSSGSICTKTLPAIDVTQDESFKTEFEGLQIACNPWKHNEAGESFGISCTMEGVESDVFSYLALTKADVFLGAPKVQSEPYSIFLSCQYSKD